MINGVDKVLNGFYNFKFVNFRYIKANSKGLNVITI